jgi:hypothetical protein
LRLLNRVTDNAPTRTRPNPAVAADAWPAVGWLTVALAIFTFVSLHTIGAAKDAAVAIVLGGGRLAPGTLLRALGAADFVGVALAVLAVIGLAWLEWRRRSFSRLLTATPRGPTFAALVLLLAWLGHAYGFPGVLLAADTASHVSRFLEVRLELEQGILPQWTNYDYMGSSLLGFTGPLTYVVGGVLDFFVRDPVATSKLLLFALHMAAGGLCYALLRRFGIGRFGATVGALGYAGSFAILHLFLYRGLFPQGFTICFLLLAFLAAEGLMRPGPMRWRDWAGFALATGGLIVNHQPHAPFVALYLLIFGLVSLWLGRWRLGGAAGLVTAGLVGVVMSAVAVLPVLREADWVMIEPAI